MAEEKEYTLEELENELDEKNKLFCHEYIVDWAKAKAYMRAYPDSSYEAAAVSANRLLKNAKILTYISLIKNNLEEEAGISKIGNLKLLKGMAEKGDSESAKVAALREINNMMGYNAPIKTDITGDIRYTPISKEEAKEIASKLKDEC